MVYGHWLMAVFTVQEGQVVARHMLAEAPWTQILTWFFQVMPVFFMVGGYSNAASWTAAERSGKSYADWLRSRCQRLLGPTVVFALVWIPIALCMRLVIPDPDILVMAGKLVAVPLWFMAVYLVVIPLAPLMMIVHRHMGVAAPLVLTLLAAAVDIFDPAIHIKGQPIPNATQHTGEHNSGLQQKALCLPNSIDIQSAGKKLGQLHSLSIPQGLP